MSPTRAVRRGPGRSLRRQLPLGPQAAAEARRSLRSLEGVVPHQSLADVRLMVSELVTNSYRHAGLGHDDVAVLRVEVEAERLHVEVEDRGRGFRDPPEQRGGSDREDGWGLTIVRRLAQRWGIRQNGSTIVWFDVDLRPAGC